MRKIPPLFKISDKFCDNNIFIEDTPSGVTCKVSCTECGFDSFLSSSEHNATGKISFSTYNVRRHYATHSLPKDVSNGASSSAATKPSMDENLLIDPTTQSPSCQEECNVFKDFFL